MSDIVEKAKKKAEKDVQEAIACQAVQDALPAGIRQHALRVFIPME